MDPEGERLDSFAQRDRDGIKRGAFVIADIEDAGDVGCMEITHVEADPHDESGRRDSPRRVAMVAYSDVQLLDVQ